MPRFLSATPDTRLIPLPWNVGLAEWPTHHLVALPRGISRHVVRFIGLDNEVYAAKEVHDALAIHEYRMLHDLMRLGTPSVEPVAVVTGRSTLDGTPLDSILLTRHLTFSLPYRQLFSPGVTSERVGQLIDALVILVARLHLIGFKWGDISLSNALFRRDAGGFAAHLVDAETGEFHTSLTDGQREHDLMIARTNLFGEFCDLEAGGLLDPGLDPLVLVNMIDRRYQELWSELTGVEEFPGAEIHRIEHRAQRLNDLGFDIAELDITTTADGSSVRIQPKVIDAGHHSRRLQRLTGMTTEENQARRLLHDLDEYRRASGQTRLDEATVAHRWLQEAFEPVMREIPEDLFAKLEPAQIFHEVLDYRWFSSEAQGREVPLDVAARGYVRDVLTQRPDEELSDVQLVEGDRVPANPYDPSHGYLEDDDTAPVDPWETGDDDDLPDPDFLDIAALRRKADGR
ncbi:MAG: DUF4032 domain-containing protein [Propionibacterium sp.]|nr:DUF4032 domain-containing protein [Propionibacterium sp.]